MTDYQNVALAIREARESRAPIAPISQEYGITDPDAAYQIQQLNTELYESQGRKVVGCKIGLTSEAVQEQLGVDQPDYGVLWEDQSYSDGDSISVSQYMQPKVEAEIAFIIKNDINDPNITLEELSGAIDCALPAIEIVDSAIADWKISLADTIADNASAAGYALGTDSKQIGEVDLRLAGMVLTKNGKEVSYGVTAACMGNPLEATLWLVRKMIEIGHPLKAGDIVLSGALGPMVEVSAGDSIKVEISGFESFTVDFVS
jgi:2-keto-4-pentenoate hydratase